MSPKFWLEIEPNERLVTSNSRLLADLNGTELSVLPLPVMNRVLVDAGFYAPVR